MRSVPTDISNLPRIHVKHLLRLAGVVACASALIGGYVWLIDLADRDDGDALRWGFWHNPFMQFPPFDEAFLDLSMWVLLACSVSAGVGGVMLLVPLRLSVPLVKWQARVAIIFNGVTAFFIVMTMFVFAKHPWAQWHLGGTLTALVLRLGTIAVDLTLLIFLSSDAVKSFHEWHPRSNERGFDVIMNGPDRSG